MKTTTSVVIDKLEQNGAEPVEGIKNLRVVLETEETKTMYKGNNIFRMLVKWYLYRRIKWIKCSFRIPFTVIMIEKRTKSIDVGTKELAPGIYSINHSTIDSHGDMLSVNTIEKLFENSRIDID